MAASRDSLEILFQKIDAVAKINEQIIARIHSKKRIVTERHYQIKTSVNKNKGVEYIAIEVPKTTEVDNILKAWKCNLELMPIRDLFNDKLNYNCKNYDDIVRLNCDMLLVCQKYDMLDRRKAKPEVAKFLKNFELLQVGFSDVQSRLIEPASEINDIKNELDTVNSILSNLHKRKHVTIDQDTPVASPAPSPSRTNISPKTPTQMMKDLFEKKPYDAQQAKRLKTLLGVRLC